MVLAAGFSIHWVRTNMLEATVGKLTLSNLIPHADLLKGTISLNLCNPLNLALALGLPLAFAFLSIQSGGCGL
jgi:hypothetical protein